MYRARRAATAVRTRVAMHRMLRRDHIRSNCFDAARTTDPDWLIVEPAESVRTLQREQTSARD